MIMMKWDLKSIFRYISINSCDHWLFIFEWLDKYYINLFLLFDFRMISCIFNLFFEILHWIFEILFHWNLTHYLNDFLFIFKSQIDLSSIMSHYNETLTEIDLTIILKKNMNDIIIIHLKFEFNSLKMKIHLSHNKYSYILHIIIDLLKIKFIIYSIFNKILDFLSHYY